MSGMTWTADKPTEPDAAYWWRQYPGSAAEYCELLEEEVVVAKKPKLKRKRLMVYFPGPVKRTVNLENMQGEWCELSYPAEPSQSTGAHGRSIAVVTARRLGLDDQAISLLQRAMGKAMDHYEKRVQENEHEILKLKERLESLKSLLAEFEVVDELELERI